MDERQQFIDEIKADPENTSVRAIFSDWLEDHDEPEEADFMRQWTLEEYQKGKKYLEEVVEQIREEGRDYNGVGYFEITYEELLDGLKESYINEFKGSIYFNFDTPDFLTLTSTLEKMWDAFSVVTTQRVKEDDKNHNPFRCGC